MADEQFAVDQSPASQMSMTFRATAAMATAFVAVKLNTSAVGYIQVAGDGEEAIGILQQVAEAAGDHVRVVVQGLSLVKANGAFTVGDKLNSGAATGKVDTAATTEYAVATALDTATAQDDEVSAWVHGKLYCV